MLENTVFVKKYDSDSEISTINYNEVLRYAGYFGKKEGMDEELLKLLDEVVDELKDSFAYKVCYRRMDISWEDGMPVLPFHSESKNLAKCLAGSEQIIIFAATIGINIDRAIAKYQRFSPTKALLMQAYGAERVEKLCDTFCAQIKQMVDKEGFNCTPRFSPGYGDLPLETQIEIFSLLDCNRQIGISLGNSLLMTPSKSVTAIFGLGKCTKSALDKKCSLCSKKDCEFRKQ